MSYFVPYQTTVTLCIAKNCMEFLSDLRTQDCDNLPLIQSLCVLKEVISLDLKGKSVERHFAVLWTSLFSMETSAACIVLRAPRH